MAAAHSPRRCPPLHPALGTRPRHSHPGSRPAALGARQQPVQSPLSGGEISPQFLQNCVREQTSDANDRPPPLWAISNVKQAGVGAGAGWAPGSAVTDTHRLVVRSVAPPKPGPPPPLAQPAAACSAAHGPTLQPHQLRRGPRERAPLSGSPGLSGVADRGTVRNRAPARHPAGQ